MLALSRSSNVQNFWKKYSIDRAMTGRLAMCAVLAACVLASASCSGRPNVFGESRDARLVRLEDERMRLAGATNPVERTRIQIRISDLMISFMGDAVSDGDIERVDARMGEYRDAVLDARDTMFNSGRDPTGSVAGYQDLEIALRQQIRQLDDISASLALAFRGPIQALITEVTEIRNELLDALFPEADPA
jgi:hypothetical protein